MSKECLSKENERHCDVDEEEEADEERDYPNQLSALLFFFLSIMVEGHGPLLYYQRIDRRQLSSGSLALPSRVRGLAESP